VTALADRFVERGARRIQRRSAGRPRRERVEPAPASQDGLDRGLHRPLVRGIGGEDQEARRIGRAGAARARSFGVQEICARLEKLYLAVRPRRAEEPGVALFAPEEESDL
jgi:hypothetical protein